MRMWLCGCALVCVLLMNFCPGSADECSPNITNQYPVCSPLYYNLTISEALKKKTNVQQVNCTDPEGQKLQWKIADGNYKNAFSITNDGMVSIKKKLDAEGKVNPYLLFIEAGDSGSPALTTTVVMIIFVTSVNDEAPQILGLPDEVEVSEDLPIGTIITQCSLLDSDSARLPVGLARVRIIEGNNDNLFVLDSRTCALALNQRLDYETMRSRRLVFQAYELDVAAPLTSEQNVTINVIDYNDHRPTCSEYIILLTVMEDTAPGTVLTSLNCSDIDVSDTLNYTIAAGSPDALTVGDSTGEVTLARTVDYETNRENRNFDVIVHVYDVSASPLTTTVIINVDVTDADDNTPDFDSDVIHIEVEEQWEVGRVIWTLNASDGDSPATHLSSVTYNLVSSPVDWFYVHPNTGMVVIQNLIDRESHDNVLLTVSAHSSNRTTVTSTVLLNITIADHNDNRPRFNQTFYEGQISEGASPGTVVLDLTAFDDDFGASGDITYSINSTAFSINPSTGQIILANSLDYEAHKSYMFVATATDTANGTEQQSSQAIVRVEVDGVNEAAPMWKIPPANTYVYVTENTAPGTPLFTVSASDDDQGEDGRVTYRLLQPSASPFLVNSQQGIVTLRSKLDRESQDSYVLVLSARDSSPLNPKSSSATLTVSVTDYNDNAPVCQHVPPVLVSASTGETLLTLTCSDPDLGNSSMAYVKTKGDVSGVFYVDVRTGEIKLFREPTLPQYEVVFEVRDGANPEYSTYTAITFIIENSFSFSNLPAVVEISENTEVGSVVFDADTMGTNLPSFFKISQPEGVFTVQPSTGQIFLTSAVDREVQEKYELTLTSYTAARQRVNSTLTVVVLDINDNSPVIKGKFNVSVMEDRPVPYVLQRFSASDDDAKENGMVTFRIRSGNEDSLFSLASDGTLSVIEPLDAESTQLHELVIVAEDGGQPPLTAEKHLYIAVKNVDEFKPQFTIAGQNLNLSIPEDIAVGSRIGGVVADDADLFDDVKFDLIAGNDGDYFVINRNSGSVFVAKPLDYEEHSQFDLIVQISNAVQENKVTDITVTVEDVNDNAPVFSKAQYAFEVPDAAGVDTVVGEVIITDADDGTNAEFTLQIVNGDDDNTFIFNNTTLQTNKLINISVDSSYLLTVRATDRQSPGLFSDVQAFITVIPEKRTPKFLVKIANITVEENSLTGTAIYDFQATAEGGTEGEDGDLVYSLASQTDTSLFHMEQDTGRLYLTHDLDYETARVHNLSIRVENRYDSELFDVMTLTVNVVNVNDVSPTFTQSTYAWSVEEGLHNGTSVGSVTARDSDGGPYGQVRYTLLSDSRFSINATSGEVTLTGLVEYNHDIFFSLSVMATDQAGKASLTGTAAILIHMIDVNDHVPKFPSVERVVSVPESRAVGSVVTVLQPQDNDHGDNANVTCHIADGNQNGEFHITPDACTLTIAGSLDAESQITYVLTITASDKGKQPLTGTTTLTVRVIDENDNAPNFTKSIAQVELARTDPAGTEVYTAEAVDADSGKNGMVMYGLHSDHADSIFSLNPLTGRVHTVTTLTSARDSYTLLITAFDRGYPAQTATLTLHVDIIPSLKASSANFTFTVRENSVPRTVVGVMPSDSSKTGLSYSIIAGNYRNAFRVVTDSKGDGVLEVVGELDRETYPQYELEVEARHSVGVDTVVVVVHVSDVNDNAPRFSAATLTFHVVENLPVSTTVASLQVSDLDDGANGQITLRFSNSTSLCDTYFSLSSAGAVSIKQPLDYEVLPRLQCQVLAVDKGTPALTATSSFTATVVDIEEVLVQTQGSRASVFLSREIPFDSSSDRLVVTLTGALLGMISAPGDTFSYISLSEDGVFTVSQDSGEVRVRRADLLYDQSRYFQWVVCRQAGSRSDTQLGMLRVDTFSMDKHVVAISFDASMEYMESMRSALTARLQLFFDNTSRAEVLEVRAGTMTTARRRLLEQRSIVLVYVVTDTATTDTVGGVDHAKVFTTQADVLKVIQLSSDGTPVVGLRDSTLPVQEVMPYQNSPDPSSEPLLETQEGLALLLVVIILLVVVVIFSFACCMWKIHKKEKLRRQASQPLLRNDLKSDMHDVDNFQKTGQELPENQGTVSMIAESDNLPSVRDRRTSVEVKRELDNLLPLPLRLTRQLHLQNASTKTGVQKVKENQIALNQMIAAKKDKKKKKRSSEKEETNLDVLSPSREATPTSEEVDTQAVLDTEDLSVSDAFSAAAASPFSSSSVSLTQSQTLTTQSASLNPSPTPARHTPSDQTRSPALSARSVQVQSSTGAVTSSVEAGDGDCAKAEVGDVDDGISMECLDIGTTSTKDAKKTPKGKFKLFASIFAALGTKQSIKAAQSTKRASMPAIAPEREGQSIRATLAAKTKTAFSAVDPKLREIEERNVETSLGETAEKQHVERPENIAPVRRQSLFV